MSEHQVTPPMDAEEQEQAIKLLALQVYEKEEALIGDLEEFVKLTDGDLKLIIDDLRRLKNFLDAFMEAHPITYQLAEVMSKLELDEGTLRKLLADVGVQIQREKQDPEETVTYHELVLLLADRAGSKEGDLLGDFFRGDKPQIVCG